MKRTAAALMLTAALILTGCGSILDRDYQQVTTYEPVSTADDNSSALRVENYQELVNSVLYLVEQGVDSGVINLYNYTGDVGDDLARACLEVTQEDPYGAYMVEYIKQEYTLLVTYYEVDLTFAYRHTQEQAEQIVDVTGRSAIRQQLSDAMAGFSDQAVLYLNYFDGDAGDIEDLAKEAYYSDPASAQGFPEMNITFYPDSGSQRIVEIDFSYDEDTEILAERSRQTQEMAQELLNTVRGGDPSAQTLFNLLEERLEHQENEETDENVSGTAWAALNGQLVDSEGAALAYQLLCDLSNVESVIVQGSLRGEDHFWNIVTEDDQSRHVDLSDGLFGLTDNELTGMAPYDWDRTDYPACQDEEEAAEQN
ncbi:MAG: hypothetical protein LUC17_04915 [Oscillospiraceae bacterium]|nr:hypothetical protein [Oscillospiraceae bacterium]